MSGSTDSAWKGLIGVLVLTIVPVPLAAQTRTVESHIHVTRNGEPVNNVEVRVMGTTDEAALGTIVSNGWLDFSVTIDEMRFFLQGVEGNLGAIRVMPDPGLPPDEQRQLSIGVFDPRGRLLVRDSLRWEDMKDIEDGFVIDLSLARVVAGNGAAAADGVSAAPPAPYPVNTYIDSAIVRTQFRIRFDAAYDNPLPDRAEFFYGQCGCFGPPAPGPGTPGGIGGMPSATFATDVDYQEFSLYFEQTATDRLSGFIEVPFRLLNPDGLSTIDNAGGLSDINAGFKYALCNLGGEYLTFQLRVYTPTGEGDRGLGTAHVSLEPALLYHRQFGERLSLYGEVRDWIPLSDSQFEGEDFAGNVLRYGLGLGYDLASSLDCSCNRRRLTPFVEFVGWSILDGLAFDGNRQLADTDPVVSVAGDTIVNVKAGLRYSWNEHSVAVSYGRALTGHAWYEDIARFEYRIMF